MSYVRTAVRIQPNLPFELQSLDEIAAPSGCEGIWHRYVITQGDNTIVGTRSGLRAEVSAAVAEVVGRLNLRFSKAAPAASYSRPRGRPKKQAAAAVDSPSEENPA